jgi:hypothetical protein
MLSPASTVSARRMVMRSSSLQPAVEARRSHSGLALLRALKPRTGPLAFAHFDAHLDTRQL